MTIQAMQYLIGWLFMSALLIIGLFALREGR